MACVSHVLLLLQLVLWRYTLLLKPPHSYSVLLQVEEEHASLVKTKSELEQTKSQLEGEVAGGQRGGRGGGEVPGLECACVCVCAHMEERVVSMFINWI